MNSQPLSFSLQFSMLSWGSYSIKCLHHCVNIIMSLLKSVKKNRFPCLMMIYHVTWWYIVCASLLQIFFRPLLEEIKTMSSSFGGQFIHSSLHYNSSVGWSVSDSPRACFFASTSAVKIITLATYKLHNSVHKLNAS